MVLRERRGLAMGAPPQEGQRHRPAQVTAELTSKEESARFPEGTADTKSVMGGRRHEE